MNTQVNRSQTETYKVYIDNRWQATIMVEECSGLLSIQSEYGAFSHYWGTSGRAKGNTFKQELLRFDLDYVERKLAYNDELGNWFNFDKTVNGIKRDILKKRRELTIDSSEARILRQQAEDLEDNKSVSDFSHQIVDSHLFLELYSGDCLSIPIVTETHPRLKKFMKEIYPIFKAELAKEEGV